VARDAGVIIGISCFLSFVSCVTTWPTISCRPSTATCTLQACAKPSGPFMIRDSGSQARREQQILLGHVRR
jgi:hypothetical protein